MDYGWSILGVQYVATSQFNRKKISEVVSNIFMIQMVLALIGIFILIILMLFFPDLNIEKWLFLSAYGLVPANMMIAPWCYLGMERVKYINMINFSARIIYLMLIFILLNNKDQYLLVPKKKYLEFIQQQKKLLKQFKELLHQ